MIALVFVVVVVAAAPPSLEQAFGRESALLAGERDALVKEREAIATSRATKAEALRKDIAALEAAVVDDAAAVEAAKAAIVGGVGAEGARVDAAQSGGAESGAARVVVADTFAALGKPMPTWGDERSLIEALGPALDALEQARTPRAVDSGFFDADGRYVDGRVVFVGGFGFGAAGDVAGPLLPAVEGARQLAVVDAVAADAARAVVEGRATALAPIALSAPPATTAPTSTLARLPALGGSGVALVLALLSAIVVASVVCARAVLALRALTAAAARVVALVGAGEDAAAGALARSLPGAVGRLLHAVVVVARDRDPDAAVSALLVEACADVDRGVFVVRAVCAAAVAVCIAAAADAFADAFGAVDVNAAVVAGLVPVELLALWSLPVLVLLVVHAGVAARLRERIEVAALRIVDGRG